MEWSAGLSKKERDITGKERNYTIRWTEEKKRESTFSVNGERWDLAKSVIELINNLKKPLLRLTFISRTAI